MTAHLGTGIITCVNGIDDHSLAGLNRSFH
jgi:hypothetical protein